MQVVISIIIAVSVLWFAVSNVQPITMQVFIWDVTGSIAIVTGAMLLLGFLLGVLYLVPRLWRARSAAKQSERALAETRKERDALAERAKVLEAQVRQLAPMHASSQRLDGTIERNEK